MVDKETMVATSFVFIEGQVYVHAFVLNLGGFKSAKELIEHAGADPIPVRKIDLNMTLQEFFSRFKRFDVMLTSNSLGLTGRGSTSRCKVEMTEDPPATLTALLLRLKQFHPRFSAELSP